MDKFRKRLTGLPILFDGAMGTEIYQHGVYVNQCFDELNLSKPDLIAQIHLDYLKAGAEVITTNTYGANRFKLSQFGLGEDVININRTAAELAKKAISKSKHKAFVAGCIGSLGKNLMPIGSIDIDEAKDAFMEQATGLVEGGVDVISIETMANSFELFYAIEAVRQITDLPIIAQFTLKDWNESAYGASISEIVSQLANAEFDVLGVNCSLGPSKLLDAAKELEHLSEKPIIIQPNAGELEWVDGRLICKATPEYFAEYAKRFILSGVKIVGGCCGSTPAHIKAMSSALKAVIPELSSVKLQVSVSETSVQEPFTQEEPKKNISLLAKKLYHNEFVASIELHPPRSPSVGKLIERVKELKNNGIHFVNIPDGPRASARLSAMVLATVLRRETNIEPILHYTCRDRNILGIQSDLLGAETLDLDNLLCITGDPPKLGDYPMATAVFDVDAIGLIRIANNLNHDLDLIGNSIPKGTSFFIGCGANPGAMNLEMEIDRLHKKIDNGARYIMTQPVFEEELLFNFIDKFSRNDIPILVGILPLVSFRNAEFYHNEVPGMQVPQHIRDKFKNIDNKEIAAQIGIEVAAEALINCSSRVNGVYIMPPFGKTELGLEVLRMFQQSSQGNRLKLNKEIA